MANPYPADWWEDYHFFNMKRTSLKRKQPLRSSKLPLRASKPRKRPSARTRRKYWTSKRADAEFSRYIRARDKRCFFCTNPATQNSHFWGRAHSATRYDPLNCDGICGGCHMRHEGNKQGLYRTKKIAQLGKATYNALEKRAASIVKREDAIKDCMRFLGAL